MSYLEQVIGLVQEAGRILLSHYRRKINVVTKADHSPLTEADLASHRFLCAALADLCGLPVLSEEDVVAYDHRMRWEQFWLVDPLDGTKDFLAQNDEFTINVALIDRGEPVLGIVHAPALDELFHGERGLGAYLRKGTRQERLPWTRCEEPVVLRSRFHDTSRTDEFMQRNSLARSLRVGSALKFGRLAEGVASLYPRYSGSFEWDIAAGHAILKESGCRMILADTVAEPVYNTPSLRMGSFFACAGWVDFDQLYR